MKEPMPSSPPDHLTLVFACPPLLVLEISRQRPRSRCCCHYFREGYGEIWGRSSRTQLPESAPLLMLLIFSGCNNEDTMTLILKVEMRDFQSDRYFFFCYFFPLSFSFLLSFSQPLFFPPLPPIPPQPWVSFSPISVTNSSGPPLFSVLFLFSSFIILLLRAADPT